MVAGDYWEELGVVEVEGGEEAGGLEEEGDLVIDLVAVAVAAAVAAAAAVVFMVGPLPLPPPTRPMHLPRKRLNEPHPRRKLADSAREDEAVDDLGEGRQRR